MAIFIDNAQTAGIIRALCKSKGIAVSTLLKDCGIRNSLIPDLETRNYTPSAHLLGKVADYLDVSVDYLLGRTDNPEVNK